MADEKLLSAVLEPRRRAILRVLEAEGGLPVGRLATHFDVSRPAISQHLAVLKDAGLVEMHSERGRNTYAVVAARIADAREAIADLVADLPGVAPLDPAASAPAAPVAPAAAEDPVAPATSFAPGASAEGSAATSPSPLGPPPDVALEAFAAAPVDVVFEIASTAAGQALWLGRADADATLGGLFHVDLGGDAAAGTYSAVDAPTHLAFGWGQEGGPMAPDSSRVDLIFTPTDRGTLIRLEHRGLPEFMHAPHLGSWAHHLPRLAEAATGAA